MGTDDVEKWEGERYDYLVVTADRHTHASDPDHLRRELTRLGGLGWRLVIDRDDALIFVRPVPRPVPPESAAVRGVLTIEGAGTMGLTVDTTPGQEAVVYGFEDDHGNPDGPPAGDGSGITVAFASSDPTLATVGDPVPGTDAAGNPTVRGPITVVTTVPATPGPSFTGVASNVDGGALTASSGAAWIDPPATDPVPITAGDAVEGTLSVASS